VAAAEPRPFDLALGEFRLTGVLRGLSPAGQFGHSFAVRSGFTLLTAWLRHLALNAVKPPGVGLATRWLTRNAHLEFSPVEGAEDLLAKLVARYWEGLQSPLEFPIRTALSLLEEGDYAARQTWAGNFIKEGQNTDPWFRLLYGEERAALPDELQALAGEILQPLVSHLTDTTLGELWARVMTAAQTQGAAA
jgi:exodeoxyribonuclease V gamma subunit